jgi:hypothetical protein
MARRIAFRCNYRRVDTTALRQDLIRALYSQHTMLVVFGKTHGMASLRQMCQTAAVHLYIEFFRDPAKYERAARAGHEGKRGYCVKNRLFKRQALGEQSGTISWSEALAAPGS